MSVPRLKSPPPINPPVARCCRALDATGANAARFPAITLVTTVPETLISANRAGSCSGRSGLYGLIRFSCWVMLSVINIQEHGVTMCSEPLDVVMCCGSFCNEMTVPLSLCPACSRGPQQPLTPQIYSISGSIFA